MLLGQSMSYLLKTITLTCNISPPCLCQFPELPPLTTSTLGALVPAVSPGSCPRCSWPSKTWQMGVGEIPLPLPLRDIISDIPWAWVRSQKLQQPQAWFASLPSAPLLGHKTPCSSPTDSSRRSWGAQGMHSG